MKKPNYIKESTRDLSNPKKIVNPELKKRNDKLFKALVDSLNKNAIKKSWDTIYLFLYTSIFKLDWLQNKKCYYLLRTEFA